ncbi:MAG TPA: DNA methyltransferase [Verrucomicrobiota bacterium]|nr:site-specific DNA-methyltransferase [Verrucomicrobiales bacterium]HRI16385.1 DNA methyltransferase [Verrucomicrobiota bacterium]
MNESELPVQEKPLKPEAPVATVPITRTELVWPGKYNPDGTRKEVPRVSLPFQVIETINESRATRESEKTKGKSLFDFYQGNEGDTFEAGWKNKLIWGDNLLVMGSLLEKFAGKIDLIYIDPPFATGADFSFTAQVGDGTIELTKEGSAIEEKAYRDTWGQGLQSYLGMLYSRLTIIRELLSPKGHLYVHLDYRLSHYARVLLDELFGMDAYRNEIAWKRSNPKNDPKQYGRIHDTILYYKGEEAEFYPVYGDYREEYLEQAYRHEDADGRRYRLLPLHATHKFSEKDDNTRRFGDKVLRPPLGKFWRWSQKKIDKALSDGLIVVSESDVPQYKKYLDLAKGVPAQSIWDDIPQLTKDETLGYPTQKPEALLHRIISASTQPGDLVADLFCGSGTTLSVAEKLKRRWIGADLGRYSAHTSRKRLLDIEECKPFELLNLGKYERQYWQGVTFGGNGRAEVEQTLFEYLAFILRLYGAQPVPGMANLHGKKGRAMVHIGAVDAPVTIDEVNAALAECLQLKQPELHILAWEWEMGLNDLMVEEAKKQRIKLLLLNIPREVMEQQAVDKGDIRFFELAYVEAGIEKPTKRSRTITLKNFVIPNTDLVPEEVRSKVKKWSDYIDYWAVDWNFQNDTFMQGWVTYRTRKDRTLALTSDSHTYEDPGTYKVLVKVVDIFGNDTTQSFEVEVK